MPLSRASVRALVVILPILSSSSALVFAQAPPPPPPAGAPKFEYGKPAEVKPTDPPWKVAVQGGLILTTGNSQTTSFAGSGSVIHRVGANKMQLDAGTAYATSDIRIAVDGNGDNVIEPGENHPGERDDYRSVEHQGPLRLLLHRAQRRVRIGPPCRRPACG